ncbi:MAG: hypothetical protein U0271_02795 [Polyangiaceae bacterium]
MSHPNLQDGMQQEVLSHPVAFGCVIVGVAFWLVAYGLAIYNGFRNRTYCIPVAAVCCNIAWEAVSCFLRPPPVKLWHYGSFLWFAVDLVIVYQVFRFGRARQTIPELRQWFYPMVVGAIVLAFAGQDLLSAYIHDPFAYLSSYMINLTMSILFIFMFFARRGTHPRTHDNVAYGIGWTKMIGTGIISLALITFWQIFYPLKKQTAFVWILLSTVFSIDMIYILLLRRARALAATSASDQGSTTPATKEA